MTGFHCSSLCGVFEDWDGVGADWSDWLAKVLVGAYKMLDPGKPGAESRRFSDDASDRRNRPEVCAAVICGKATFITFSLEISQKSLNCFSQVACVTTSKPLRCPPNSVSAQGKERGILGEFRWRNGLVSSVHSLNGYLPFVH